VHELPDILDRVQFGAFGRQGQERDVCRDHQCCRGMSSGVIEEQNGMGGRRNVEGEIL
jgi:hypothetical protein